MQRSRILLHPSSYEGFSGACLEALYAGARVISFTQPQRGWIRNWQIAGNLDEMTEIAFAILSENTQYNRSLPYHIHDTVHQLMQLFPDAGKSDTHLVANSF